MSKNKEINFDWNKTIEKLNEIKSIIEDDSLDNVIKNIPQQPQVQYSLQEQLIKTYKVANKLGLYDAADYIKQHL